MDEERLFPASKPLLCEEKHVEPYLEVKCCRSDYCNKYVRFEYPRRGEMTIQQTHSHTHTNKHISTKPSEIKFHSFKKQNEKFRILPIFAHQKNNKST